MRYPDPFRVRMQRALLVAILLLAALVAVAPGAAAEDACLLEDNPLGFCVKTEQCLGIDLCADPTDPHGTLRDVAEWVKDQLGPCACDPVD
ncbi:MAG TPA: hypothetical protein VGA36_02530 [Nitriliruptorales bacterium]